MTLKTGHFTQVIWRDSTELGVRMARNRNGEVYVVSTIYDRRISVVVGSIVHNEYRREHRVSDLRLSPELTADAKTLANKLLNTNKLIPQSSSPYGENIYSMQCFDPKLIISVHEVISKWYSKKKEHKFDVEPKVLNTCHFTQIVWKSTTEMHCYGQARRYMRDNGMLPRELPFSIYFCR